MKIMAKVSREVPELVEGLRANGIKAKLVRNGVIVELETFQPKGSWDGVDLYAIPEELREGAFYEAALYIDITEKGGGMTNTGSGTVVCGLSGKALRPYYVPKGYSNAEHAFFSVRDAVVTITGYRNDDNITIRTHHIQRDSTTAWIVTKEIWSGELEALPNLYGRYQAAAKAAHEKGNCYHCRHAHYVA